MKNKWFVLNYVTEDGRCPVQEFIESRSIENQAKILSQISYLKDMGPNLPRPYADLLKDGIHELRIKLSGNQVRLMYFFCYERYIVLPHSFIHHSDAVPEKEIIRAISIRNDFLRRYNKKKLNTLIKDSL